MWTFDIRLPDGHKLFRRGELPGDMDYAIAGDSGDSPELTDDGALFLDFRRFLVVLYPAREGAPLHQIPVSGPTTFSATPTDGATLLYLSSRFEWRIHVIADRVERLYEVTEVDPL